MKNLTIENFPNLFNLLSLVNVIPDDTFVEDTDSGETINLNSLINETINELKTNGVWGV